MKYRAYVITTLLYGGAVLLGIIGAVASLLVGKYLTLLLCCLIIGIGMDNFFCGSRLSSTKVCTVKTHYVIPPFLKR